MKNLKYHSHKHFLHFRENALEFFHIYSNLSNFISFVLRNYSIKPQNINCERQWTKSPQFWR